MDHSTRRRWIAFVLPLALAAFLPWSVAAAPFPGAGDRSRERAAPAAKLPSPHALVPGGVKNGAVLPEPAGAAVFALSLALVAWSTRRNRSRD